MTCNDCWETAIFVRPGERETSPKTTPLPRGAFVDGMAAVLADALLLTAAPLAPPTKRKQGSRGWCSSEEVVIEMNVKWLEITQTYEGS